MGFMPGAAEVGDEIAVFRDLRQSMIIRRDEHERFILVGESFVHELSGSSSETDFSRLQEIVFA